MTEHDGEFFTTGNPDQVDLLRATIRELEKQLAKECAEALAAEGQWIERTGELQDQIQKLKRELETERLGRLEDHEEFQRKIDALGGWSA